MDDRLEELFKKLGEAANALEAQKASISRITQEMGSLLGKAQVDPNDRFLQVFHSKEEMMGYARSFLLSYMAAHLTDETDKVESPRVAGFVKVGAKIGLKTSQFKMAVKLLSDYGLLLVTRSGDSTFYEVPAEVRERLKIAPYEAMVHKFLRV